MAQVCSVCCRDAEVHSDRALRKLTQVQLAVTEICGRARNSYSKGVLKKDFKDGLLEMEETAADVELDAEGNPLLPASTSSMPSTSSCCAVLSVVSSLISVSAAWALQHVMKSELLPRCSLAKIQCYAVEAACSLSCPVWLASHVWQAGSSNAHGIIC